MGRDRDGTEASTLLEGEALAIWQGLREEQQQDCKTVKEKLKCKIMLMGFTSLEEFHRR